VILGGVSTALGPILGSAIFILLEETLSSYTIYWQLPFGLMLIGVVLFIRGGIMGLFKGRDK
jgi:branched-chain amino acid transport system permease protein